MFWKRKFEPEVIVTCVRWYLRFCLSLRDLQELMAERGLAVHHTSIWRRVQAYGPEVHRRLHGEVKRKSSTWHMDETFVITDPKILKCFFSGKESLFDSTPKGRVDVFRPHFSGIQGAPQRFWKLRVIDTHGRVGVF